MERGRLSSYTAARTSEPGSNVVYPKLIVADAELLFRDCLVELLKQHQYEVLATANNGPDVLSLCRLHKPDALLLSARLPEITATLVTEQLRHQFPHLKILLLASPADFVPVLQAVRLGVQGVLSKMASAAQSLHGLRQVLAGQFYLPEQFSPLLVQALVQPEHLSADQGLSSLSLKQKQILQLTAEGHTAREIAARLYISNKTVEFHRSTISKKLGLSCPSDWIRFALRHQLIQL